MRLLPKEKRMAGRVLLMLASSLNLWGCGKVWVKDSTGTAIPAVADLKEGGYYRSDLGK